MIGRGLFWGMVATAGVAVSLGGLLIVLIGFTVRLRASGPGWADRLPLDAE